MMADGRINNYMISRCDQLNTDGLALSDTNMKVWNQLCEYIAECMKCAI